MSLSDKQHAASGDMVYLVRGKDGSRAAWHYVRVERLKLPQFLKRVESGSLDIAEFGAVLYSGWGDAPPSDVMEAVMGRFVHSDAA